MNTPKLFLKRLPSIAAALLSAALVPARADTTHIAPKAAFADTSYETQRTPVYAINGDGIDEATGTHGVAHQGKMWMGKNSGNTGGAKFAKWFVVDLGAVYALDRMKIWNFNMNNGASYASRGVKQIDIYVSVTDSDFSGRPTFSDASTWTLFKENHVVASATGTSSYTGDEPVAFNGTSARWVGFWIDTLQASDAEYGGLSEVRFWAASGATVTPVGSPTVASSTSATLAGSVRNATGGTYPVRLVYGSVAEGDDPAAWSGATAWTSRGDGDFSVTLSGLVPDTEYQAAFELDTGSASVYGDPVEFSTATIAVAVPANFYECDSPQTGIVFSRPASAASRSLEVAYTMGGTAVSGTDYAALPGTVTLAAGETSATVNFSAIDNAAADGARTVSVTVAPGLYVAGAAGSFSILDDETDAAEFVWTGAGDGTGWGDPDNWSAHAVPTAIDTAIFRSAATVELGASRSVAALVVENAGALVLGTASDKTAGHTLSSRSLACSGAETDSLAIGAPFLFSATPDGTNTLVNAVPVVFNASFGATASRPVLKTGAGTMTLAATLSGTAPRIWVKEGSLSAAAKESLRGPTWVGGGNEAASLVFTRSDVIAGNQQGTLTVLTNGTASIRLTGWGNCYQYLVARNGGVIQCDNASFALKVTLRGGTVSCGASDRIQAAGYWGQGIESEASPLTAYYRAGMTLNHYDAPNPAYLTIADGEAPVDLVMTGSFGWTDAASSKSIEKRGAGVLKMTATIGASSSSPFRVAAGTLLCDNASGTPIGNTELSVRPGATLGGTGFIGGTARGNVVVAGASDRPALVAPGSIDEETGSHLYGTLTVGSETQTNLVSLGSWTKLVVGAGARDPATRQSAVDKLLVHGALEIGENATLDLVSHSAADPATVRGGTYVIAEADRIVGSFATILKPTNGWKVDYETETVEGDEVVKRIVLSIPGGATVLIVR